MRTLAGHIAIRPEVPASIVGTEGGVVVTRTYEFSVYVEGADLTVASTVEQLERAGYTHPAAAASVGIQALVFSRPAERLADAAESAAAEAECIAEVWIARNVRSGAVAVFDPVTMEPMDLDADATPTDPTAAMPARPQRRIGRSQHIGSPLPLR